MQGRRRRPSGAPQGSYSHVYCSWLVWPIWDAIEKVIVHPDAIEKVWGGCGVGEGGPAVEPPGWKTISRVISRCIALSLYVANCISCCTHFIACLLHIKPHFVFRFLWNQKKLNHQASSQLSLCCQIYCILSSALNFTGENLFIAQSSSCWTALYFARCVALCQVLCIHGGPSDMCWQKYLSQCYNSVQRNVPMVSNAHNSTQPFS